MWNLSISAYLTMAGYIIIGLGGTDFTSLYAGRILKSFAVGNVFACAFAMADACSAPALYLVGINGTGKQKRLFAVANDLQSHTNRRN